MDFIITFRTDLFIKVYQRILSADYTVLSILPSANPLNAWDGFSVIGGNVYTYGLRRDCVLRTCLTLAKLLRGRAVQKNTKPAFGYMCCCHALIVSIYQIYNHFYHRVFFIWPTYSYHKSQCNQGIIRYPLISIYIK